MKLAAAARSSASWLVLCAVLILACIGVWAAEMSSGPSYARAYWLIDHLSWSAEDWRAQPWTLWTACFVHLSGAHLLANVLALAALAVLGASLRVGRGATLALLLAWPLGTFSLLAWPEVTSYSGLSGLIHAAVAVLWAWTALHAAFKPVSFVLVAGLGLKLLTEHAWSQPVAFSPEWGFNVVYAAHLGSALAGAAMGWPVAGASWLCGRRARHPRT